MLCPNIQRHELTDRARLKMQRRAITELEVQLVLAALEQSAEGRTGRCVYQSRMVSAVSSKMY
ncbi:MAG: hypothetical protein ONB44_24565 [candidate division KSB1 bacterium]|nr:hypothetical protein [candidate division KSB1 bacterium]MDZ7305310.1 hypothetical protein [candidate division KSB1 bacterium]